MYQNKIAQCYYGEQVQRQESVYYPTFRESTSVSYNKRPRGTYGRVIRTRTVWHPFALMSAQYTFRIANTSIVNFCKVVGRTVQCDPLNLATLAVKLKNYSQLRSAALAELAEEKN